MMDDYTLALEGSTYGGSVALLRGANVIAERTLLDNGIPSKEGRPERVLPSVAECFEEAKVGVGEIARVVCGAGPGSFTSLRISASIAKGIAVGAKCPIGKMLRENNIETAAQHKAYRVLAIENGSDAALRPTRRAVFKRAFADQPDLEKRRQPERCRLPGKTASDHENIETKCHVKTLRRRALTITRAVGCTPRCGPPGYVPTEKSLSSFLRKLCTAPTLIRLLRYTCRRITMASPKGIPPA